MDEETKRCQNMVLEMIKGNIRDLVTPFGYFNTIKACHDAFNFLLNEKTKDYEDFKDWCDLANLNAEYWQKLALMTLAYELNFKPWLRGRVSLFLKDRKNLTRLRTYYCDCCEKEYHNFLEEI